MSGNVYIDTDAMDRRLNWMGGLGEVRLGGGATGRVDWCSRQGGEKGGIYVFYVLMFRSSF